MTAPPVTFQFGDKGTFDEANGTAQGRIVTPINRSTVALETMDGRTWCLDVQLLRYVLAVSQRRQEGVAATLMLSARSAAVVQGHNDGPRACPYAPAVGPALLKSQSASDGHLLPTLSTRVLRPGNC